MKRAFRLFVAGLLSAFVSVNVLAFMQARAMTTFADGGERPARPEDLGVLDKIGVMLSGVHIVRLANYRTPADLQLSFTTHGYPNPNGLMLEAWHVAGNDDRPLVVLFHGYAANKSTLLNTARVFHRLEYNTLLVDFYGSGGSSGTGTTIGVKEAEDVAATVNYVKRTWPNRKIIIYGISMGGAAVLRAIATQGVKPDAVIIEATFDSLLNTGKNRFRAMGLPGSPFAELLLFWGSVQNGFNFFSHNPVDYARAVSCPGLILQGEKDEHATTEGARSIAQAMGRNARLIAYPGVPHMPILDARPDQWMWDVQNFLERLG